MTSDLPTSTQGGGNYGAIGIGRPPIRRSSVPANPQPKQQPRRKISCGKYYNVHGSITAWLDCCLLGRQLHVCL